MSVEMIAAAVAAGCDLAAYAMTGDQGGMGPTIANTAVAAGMSIAGTVVGTAAVSAVVTQTPVGAAAAKMGGSDKTKEEMLQQTKYTTAAFAVPASIAASAATSSIASEMLGQDINPQQLAMGSGMGAGLSTAVVVGGGAIAYGTNPSFRDNVNSMAGQFLNRFRPQPSPQPDSNV